MTDKSYCAPNVYLAILLLLLAILLLLNICPMAGHAKCTANSNICPGPISSAQSRAKVPGGCVRDSSDQQTSPSREDALNDNVLHGQDAGLDDMQTMPS